MSSLSLSRNDGEGGLSTTLVSFTKDLTPVRLCRRNLQRPRPDGWSSLGMETSRRTFSTVTDGWWEVGVLIPEDLPFVTREGKGDLDRNLVQTRTSRSSLRPLPTRSVPHRNQNY